jgi:glycosyltransferase involved in cell wall biosynthesis
MGITPVYIPEMGRSINALKDYRAYQKLKQIIKEFKPDIVHTHAAKPGALGRMAARAMKVPVIVHTYHGHVFHSYFNILKTNTYIRVERYLARLSDAIIAISNQQKKELVEDFKIAPADKFHVIPLGFNLDKFQTDQQEKRLMFRSEFGIMDEEIAIGIIGRLVPVKNHELFIDAVHHVLQNSRKKIKAFIVGDGETRNALENKAKDLGISFTGLPFPPSTGGGLREASLIFTSWRSDVDVINAGLDVVALTSLNEGTPVSLIEAQAANKPIVSTRVGGIQDIVIENQTALLSDVNDHIRFKENLLQLVNDDDLRNSLGRNGADLVFEKYSVNRLAGDMRKLYYELLNKKSTKDRP